MTTPHTPDPAIIPFLASVPIFDGLGEDALKGLLAGAHMIQLPRGSQLFTRGQPLVRMKIVVNGQLKLYRETRDGEEVVLALPTRGSVIGAAAILADGPHHLSAVATEDSWLIAFPCTDLEALARSEPIFMGNVMRHMAHQMHLLRIENEHLMHMSAPQRVGCLLLQHWRKTMSRGADVNLNGKNLAAARLGMKPETFSRALAQLSEAGVKTASGKISIENVSKLIEFSCESCSAAPGECEWGHRQSPADLV